MLWVQGIKTDASWLRVAAYQVADGFALLSLGSWLSARIADTPQIEIETKIKSIATGSAQSN